MVLAVLYVKSILKNPIQEDEDEIAGYSHGYPVVCVECWTKDCKYKVSCCGCFSSEIVMDKIGIMKKVIKRIIGIVLLSSALGGLIVMTCIQIGTTEGLIAWGISLVLTIIIVVGVYLIVWKNY